MSGAVAFVFGLCALSFAAGCVLTAYVLRRDAEPAPVPAPVPVREQPKLDLRPPPDDYAARPIHRNPVMGLPISAPPDEPARPALTLVPALVPVMDEPVREDSDAVRRVLPEPVAAVESTTTDPADPNAAESNTAETNAGVPGAGPWSGHGHPVEWPVRTAGEQPVLPEQSVPMDDWFGLHSVSGTLPTQAGYPGDPDEFRRRYLRTFEAARRRTR
ncbi:hypothetical protein [Actinosynnema sp. NPDC023587]|uniref:hypothetical protein n=1 Tax=Actinosynnema sp. NPDC023587 TaxID=3154695 RepID=UPI0033FC3973